MANQQNNLSQGKGNAGHAPLVSIIMPAFNREKFIAEAIKSVLAQSFTNYELIVIDDGSTDRTLSVTNQFKSDPRIKLVKNEKNLGIASTRNKALQMARGVYIAPLDSDDVWLRRSRSSKQRWTQMDVYERRIISQVRTQDGSVAVSVLLVLVGTYRMLKKAFARSSSPTKG